jgi:hypothetical protein
MIGMKEWVVLTILMALIGLWFAHKFITEMDKSRRYYELLMRIKTYMNITSNIANTTQYNTFKENSSALEARYITNQLIAIEPMITTEPKAHLVPLSITRIIRNVKCLCQRKKNDTKPGFCLVLVIL